MKKSHALCLLFCATLLTGCDLVRENPPVIVSNEVPDSLLQCNGKPDKPVWTEDPQQDFKLAARFLAMYADAQTDCAAKLACVKEVINGGDHEKGSLNARTNESTCGMAE